MEKDNSELPGELVVDARFRDLVAAALVQDLGVWTGSAADVEESADLGLVLIKNLRLDGYAERARLRWTNEIRALEAGRGAFTTLDVLLHDLRARFAADLGQVPVLGKNRDAVMSYPQHKGTRNPDPATADELTEIAEPGDDSGHGVRIGVVDTPLVPHPLLPADIVLRDVELETDGLTPLPSVAGHATFVAGLIRMAAPGAQLDVRAGLAPESGVSTAWNVAKKIASFRRSDIDVLNLSLGCVTADGEPPLLLRRALDRLDPGVLVVAAAGNRAEDETVEQIWPAASTRVVAAGAVDVETSMKKEWVDCVAPGFNVLGPYLHGPVLDVAGRFEGVARWSGTSFAAATVSGRIAACMAANNVCARDALKLLIADSSSGVTEYIPAPAKG